MEATVTDTMRALYANKWKFPPAQEAIVKAINQLKPGHSVGSALALASLPGDVANALLTELQAHVVTFTSGKAQSLSKALAYLGVLQLCLAYYYANNDKAREELFNKLTTEHNPESPLSFTNPEVNKALLAVSTHPDHKFETSGLSSKCHFFRTAYGVPHDATVKYTEMCQFLASKFGEDSKRIAALVRPDIIEFTKKVLLSFLQTSSEQDEEDEEGEKPTTPTQPRKKGAQLLLLNRVKRVLFYCGHSNVNLNKRYYPWKHDDTTTAAVLSTLAFIAQFQRDNTPASRRKYGNASYKRTRTSKAQPDAVKAQAEAQPDAAQTSRKRKTPDTAEAQAQPAAEAQVEAQVQAQPEAAEAGKTSRKRKTPDTAEAQAQPEAAEAGKTSRKRKTPDTAEAQAQPDTAEAQAQPDATQAQDQDAQEAKKPRRSQRQRRSRTK
jgi:hypothetical protein